MIYLEWSHEDSCSGKGSRTETLNLPNKIELRALAQVPLLSPEIPYHQRRLLTGLLECVQVNHPHIFPMKKANVDGSSSTLTLCVSFLCPLSQKLVAATQKSNTSY